MTVQSQCDREGGRGGKIQTGVKREQEGVMCVCRESSGRGAEVVEVPRLHYHAHFGYPCKETFTRLQRISSNCGSANATLCYNINLLQFNCIALRGIIPILQTNSTNSISTCKYK